MALVYSVVTVNTAMIVVGHSFGCSWFMPFTEIKHPLMLTTKNNGIYAIASVMLGAAIGCITSYIGAQKMGRKFVLLFSTIPFIVGWLTIVYATSKIIFHLGYGISCVGAGSVVTIAPIYLLEISPLKYRGAIASTLAFSINLGILLASTTSPFLPRLFPAVVAIVISTIFGASCYFVPETPYFLASIGDYEKLERSLVKLRSTADVDDELKSIINVIEFESKSRFRLENFRNILTSLVLVSVLHCISGGRSSAVYAEIIFTRIKTPLHLMYWIDILFLVQLIGNIIAIMLMDFCGRRKLLLISSFGTTISLVLLFLYFYFQRMGYEMGTFDWLTIIALFLNVISAAIGLSSIHLFLAIEFFSTRLRPVVAAIFYLFEIVLYFIASVVLGPVAIVYYNVQTSLLALTVFSCVGFYYILHFLPETVGRSFMEIQETCVINHENKQKQLIEIRDTDGKLQVQFKMLKQKTIKI